MTAHRGAHFGRRNGRKCAMGHNQPSGSFPSETCVRTAETRVQNPPRKRGPRWRWTNRKRQAIRLFIDSRSRPQKRTRGPRPAGLPKNQTVSIEVALTKFLDYTREVRRRSVGTSQSYTVKAGRLLRYFGASANINAFKPGVEEDYVVTRRKEGASDHTVHKELQVLRATLRRSARLGLSRARSKRCGATTRRAMSLEGASFRRRSTARSFGRSTNSVARRSHSWCSRPRVIRSGERSSARM
jgi:hypothetical protein